MVIIPKVKSLNNIWIVYVFFPSSMNVLVRDLDLPTWRHFRQGKLLFMVNPPFSHPFFTSPMNTQVVHVLPECLFYIEKLLAAAKSSACYLKRSDWHTGMFITYSLSDKDGRQRYTACVHMYV